MDCKISNPIIAIEVKKSTLNVNAAEFIPRRKAVDVVSVYLVMNLCTPPTSSY